MCPVCCLRVREQCAEPSRTDRAGRDLPGPYVRSGAWWCPAQRNPGEKISLYTWSPWRVVCGVPAEAVAGPIATAITAASEVARPSSVGQRRIAITSLLG